MSSTSTDINEQYAKRVIAGMIWNPSDTDGFDESVADSLASDHITEIEMNYHPIMNADISVFATVSGVSVTNSKTLDMFQFCLGEFHGLSRDEDGNFVLKFAGFRHGGDIESIKMNDKGLLESEDTTKYAFILTIE